MGNEGKKPKLRKPFKPTHVMLILSNGDSLAEDAKNGQDLDNSWEDNEEYDVVRFAFYNGAGPAMRAVREWFKKNSGGSSYVAVVASLKVKFVSETITTRKLTQSVLEES